MGRDARSVVSPRSHSKRPFKHKPAHILIVDDEVSVRDFVDLVLRDAGYITARAIDGPEALQIAELFGPFDLLLTDELMPRMEGHILAQHLCQREPHLKVLYLTAYSDRLFAAKSTFTPNEAVLDKPSTVDGLLDAIWLLLEGHVRPADPIASRKAQ